MAYITPFNNLREVWEKNSERFKDKIVLYCVDEGTEFTYGEMFKSINKTSNLLLSKGIKKGDKIAFMTSNIPEFFYLFYGTLNIGAVAVPLNYTLTDEELEYMIDFSESKIVFVEEQFLDKVKQSKIEIIGIRIREDDSEKPCKSFENLIKNQPDALTEKIEIDKHDDAYISFTGGTTGKPKALLLTHNNLLVKSDFYVNFFGFRPDNAWLCNQQVYYQDHTTFFQTPFYAGGACVMPKKFSRSKFWQRVEKYKVRMTTLFPVMAKILLEEPEDVSGRDLSCVECFFIGGSEVTVELTQRFEKQFGIMLIQGIGLNDTTGAVLANPIDWQKRKIDSLGVVLEYNEVKVVDENGNKLGPNQRGELLVKGPNVLKEYYKDPKLTKELIEDGWLHTGDMVYYDLQGYYYFVGRKKHIIKKGGESIGPKEIDSKIHKHPAVHDSVTIGVPDRIYGEEIKAYVVLKKGQKLTEKKLLDYCKEHLGQTHIPKYIEFLEEIPKTSADKPDVKKLKEMDGK
ncbi:class I adenylate-forming enzyme family protein [Thermoproteota archaeon]